MSGGRGHVATRCRRLRFPPEYRHQGRLETVFIARHDSLGLITGSKGPYHPFRYADLDRENGTAWLGEHTRSLWSQG
ncbi:hypothetical protein [Streptomyces sp. NPDC004726]